MAQLLLVRQESHGAGRAIFSTARGMRWADCPAGRFSVFICYEAIFPNEVRRFVLDGADLLINISNDGWFGRSAAPAQHLAMARVRAVENRRWLLRDTNNGYHRFGRSVRTHRRAYACGRARRTRCAVRVSQRHNALHALGRFWSCVASAAVSWRRCAACPSGCTVDSAVHQGRAPRPARSRPARSS